MVGIIFQFCDGQSDKEVRYLIDIGEDFTSRTRNMVKETKAGIRRV